MADLRREFRRRLAPAALKLWPTLSNPAWSWAAAAERFGDRLVVTIPPRKVLYKIESAAASRLKRDFLVEGLDRLPKVAIRELYTYADMADIARYGEDWRATRLGQWLLAGIAAGRPPVVRGATISTERQAERYYRGYLEMYRSMQAHGYRYDGEDEMCFGIDRTGGLVLMRRGTHRLAAAHILDLPLVTGRITQIDRDFVRAIMRRSGAMTVAEAIAGGVESATRP
jgi:hypothetical protein